MTSVSGTRATYRSNAGAYSSGLGRSMTVELMSVLPPKARDLATSHGYGRSVPGGGRGDAREMRVQSRNFPMPDPGLRQADPPTHARFGVIYFGIALAVIQYIDRVCISWAMPDIRTSLGIPGPEHDHPVCYLFSAC